MNTLYAYEVTDNGEILRVFPTYREAATYLREIQPDDSQWERLGLSISETREHLDEEDGQ